GGDCRGASGACSLPGSVGRNGTLTLSLDMQAPSSPGSYRATYRLNDADGNYFGPEFWIAIVVDPPRIRVRMAAPVLDLSTPEDEGSARPVRPGDGLGFLQRATERAKTAIAQTKATMHGAGCATPWFEILGAGALVEMPLIDGVILVAVYE